MRLPIFYVLLLIAPAVLADNGKANGPLGKSLVVATKVSPPFAIKEPDGRWTGISIEL